mmetsp:Transcript_19741/g.55510  ORF Transcript_19741/g.55510 Transcript_19741/m.55510 type:complete len:265 (+) Transcript_19741:69-863(+)
MFDARTSLHVAATWSVSAAGATATSSLSVRASIVLSEVMTRGSAETAMASGPRGAPQVPKRSMLPATANPATPSAANSMRAKTTLEGLAALGAPPGHVWKHPSAENPTATAIPRTTLGLAGSVVFAPGGARAAAAMAAASSPRAQPKPKCHRLRQVDHVPRGEALERLPHCRPQTRSPGNGSPRPRCNDLTCGEAGANTANHTHANSHRPQLSNSRNWSARSKAATRRRSRRISASEFGCASRVAGWALVLCLGIERARARRQP